MAIEVWKSELQWINMDAYLGLTTLYLFKIKMHGLYFKEKYVKKVKLCYINTESSIIYIKMKDFLPRSFRRCRKKVGHLKNYIYKKINKNVLCICINCI